MHKTILALGLALVLSGCQTWGPTWSEVSGAHYYNRATLNLRPAGIERIDGISAFASYPIKIEPGEHNVLVQGPAPGWKGPNLAEFTFEAQPCKRYFINAQFQNRIEQKFEPVINYVEDVTGCQVDVATK